MNYLKNLSNKYVIKLSSKMVLCLSIAYLYLPLLVFLFTWVKFWIFLCCLIVAGWLLYNIYSDFIKNDENNIEINIPIFIFIVIILLCLGIICGLGGWFPQSSDWAKHNAVLRDLISSPWPVYYTSANNPSMLTYNIGSYLIPAVFGKIFNSFRAGEIFLFLWLEIGLILVVVNLFFDCNAQNNTRKLGVVLVFILFNGCLLGAHQMIGILTGVSTTEFRWVLENDNLIFQYKSNVTCIRFILPQIVHTWLVISIWWRKKINKNIVGLMLPVLISGVLSFCGLVFMAVINIITDLILNKKIASTLKNVFSIQNIVGAGTIGIVLFIYYSGNVFGEKPHEISFYLVKPRLILLLCFIIFEFGLYCLIVWKEQKRNGLFIGAFVLLMILPFVHMGKYNDLQIVGNVPAMFVVMIALINYIIIHKKEFLTGFLVAVIAFSSFYSLKEMSEARYQSYDYRSMMISLESWSDFNIEYNDLKYNYFTYDYKNCLFVKYFAKEDR